MADFTPYKLGIETLDSTPTGAAGLNINNNFTVVADLIESANAAIATAQTAVTALQEAVQACLTAANNLSDVADASTARSNLGLGTAATQDASSFDAAGAADAVQAMIPDVSGLLATTGDLSSTTGVNTDITTAISNASTDLSGYLSLSGGTVNGDITMNGCSFDMNYNVIRNLGNVELGGYTLNMNHGGDSTGGGTLNMAGGSLINLIDPANAQDAATKYYVDSSLPNLSSFTTSTITSDYNSNVYVDFSSAGMTDGNGVYSLYWGARELHGTDGYITIDWSKTPTNQACLSFDSSGSAYFQTNIFDSNQRQVFDLYNRKLIAYDGSTVAATWNSGVLSDPSGNPFMTHGNTMYDNSPFNGGVQSVDLYSRKLYGGDGGTVVDWSSGSLKDASGNRFLNEGDGTYIVNGSSPGFDYVFVNSGVTFADSTNQTTAALPLTGGTMNGDVSFGSYSITGAVGITTNGLFINQLYNQAADTANPIYVFSPISIFGSGCDLNMGGNNITNVGNLMDSSGMYSIQPNERVLDRDDGSAAMDWQNSLLISESAFTALDWAGGAPKLPAYDNGGITPAAGMIAYDYVMNKVMVHTGSSWETVTSA